MDWKYKNIKVKSKQKLEKYKYLNISKILKM